MSEQALATAPLSNQAIARSKASKPRSVTGALAVALKRIIWDGEEIDVAAKAADTTTRAVRLALEKPHVIRWMKNEREVFRAHVSAQNIHRAKQLRDESGNAMAQLGAMKFIEQIGDEQNAPGRGGSQQLPGFVIVVNAGVQASVTHKTIDNQQLNEG